MRTLPTTAPAANTATTPPPATPPPAPAPAPATPARAEWPGHALLDSPETARVLHSAWSGDPATVVASPPGAGKTRLVALLAAALAHRAELRVGIAAQTRQQAVEIARRLAPITDLARLVWATKVPRPDTAGTPVVAGNALRLPPSGGGIVIATTARWLYTDPDTAGLDVMLIDESWQATYADVGALGAHAAQVVCVGDPGQIAPVVTGATGRWRTAPSGPHLPAPEALRAAHGDAIAEVRLPHTWRLGPATTTLIQPAFYPELPFTSRRPPEHLTDTAGTVLPELAHRLVAAPGGPGDPALITACAQRIGQLLTATHTDATGQRGMTAADLAVVCAHVTQAAAVRAMLAAHPDVLVGTANQLQGLERSAVVVLHPLAGYRDISTFAADTGRTCVMLSRHRTHLTVILDATTPQVLATTDPGVTGVRAHVALTNTLLGTPTC